MSEDIIVDSESFTDLCPQQSNDWSIIVNNLTERCDYQLTNLLSSFVEELKRTISVSQLIGTNNNNSSSNSNSSSQLQMSSNNESSGQFFDSTTSDEAKIAATLQKMTSSKASRLDRVYNLSSNIVEKATNKIKILNLNDNTYLPLDKGFLDFIMDVI